MWLINHLKYIFESTFQSLLVKTRGKVKFYILFFVILGSLSSILAMGVSWTFIELKYPLMTFESMFFEGYSYLMLNMINSVSIVILVFLVNHYRKLNEDGEGQFSLTELFRNANSRVWLFYLMTVTGISLYYGFFYFSDVYVVNSSNNLNVLLDTMGYAGDIYYENWKDSLIWYSLLYVPIILISINIIQQKEGKLNLVSIASHWKHVLTFILIYIILSSVYVTIFELVDSLMLNVIRIPFQENYIPSLLTLILVVILNSLYYMILSKMAYYCFFSTKEIKIEYEKVEDADLLDQN